MDAVVPVLGPHPVFMPGARRPGEHACIPRQAEFPAQCFQSGLGFGLQGFGRHDQDAVGDALHQVELVGVAQIQHGGVADVGAVGGKHAVRVAGQYHVHVTRAIDVLPIQPFEVVGHVLQEHHLIAGAWGNGSQGIVGRDRHGAQHVFAGRAVHTREGQKMPEQGLVHHAGVHALGEAVHQGGAPVSGAGPQGDGAGGHPVRRWGLSSAGRAWPPTIPWAGTGRRPKSSAMSAGRGA